MLAAVQRGKVAFESASPTLQNDKEFQIAAIQVDPRCLEYTSPSVRDDREIVLRS